MSPWLGSAAHSRWLEAESDRLLTFSRASRHPSGGFAWLDAGGDPELDRPVELWITCRMTHVFSLGHLMGRPGCGPLVDHGIARPDGPVPRRRERRLVRGRRRRRARRHGRRRAYEHAFVVLAAASAAAAGRPGAADLLDEAVEVLLTRFWDDEHGMVVEEWDETFSTLDGYRGVNANMHTVEALLAAADATGDAALLRPRAADRDPGRARPRPRPRLADARALRRRSGPRCSTTTQTPRPTRSARTARRSGTGWSGPD